MPRYLKFILWGCSVLLAVVALSVLVAATFNWNHARPWINKQVSALVDRPVAIEGDLSVKWLRMQEQSGWRGWVPWPEITAQQVTVGNPEGSMLEGNMAEVKNLTFVINPLALLDNTIELPRLKIEQANVALNRDEQGVNNWTFTRKNPNDQKPSRWEFDVQQIQVAQARVHVVDVASKLNMNAELESLQETSKGGYGIGFKASGSYNDADISGEGQAGDILSLRAGSDPFPLQGKVSVGETTIGIEGSVTKPQQLAALDVKLSLAGNSMADLHPLIGVTLPSTPPYSTEGRLIGMLEGDDDKWRYENFKGVVGESDLQGTLEYQQRKPRSLLTGHVESKLLRFKDLGPLIGANTSNVKGKGEKDKVKQPPGKVLPVDPIGTKAWGTMDADVKFKGVKILRDKNLPLDDIDAHIKLQDRVLSFTPLNFGFAGGTLGNTITLDGRGEKIQAEMETAARHLKLKQLFPGAESMDASFGELHGDATLKGQGGSIAELLGHANGEIKALVSRGTVSSFLMEAAGLNVANMLMLKLFGDEQVMLNCVASNFVVRDGLMQIRVFKLETEDTTVDITGDINLRTEAIDLDVRPENKTLRVFTLRSPLYAKGTFKNPDVGVQMGPLAARAGAAIALGVVATPFAALLPLLNTGTNESNDCEPVLGKSEKKPSSDKPAEKQEAENPRDNWPSSQARP
ncbi:AsmA family protein [Pollutimonas nitritireducens]|uniref:AsmA family protein n=1 Tax=Pollutimonas nitritireducens TaxID=2045209 RepID=A0A2N4UBE5_9BURK|nr:AsmA family protein [Pollutimonas nitritireducens]PLC52327.1 AsmA family protein [Pollutimonas nitritireducens]